MNVLSKIGLIIIVASLSALCGNSFIIFRGSGGSSLPMVRVVPETYAGVCTFLVSYNYTMTINSNATVEFMVIPFNHLFEQYGKHNDYAIANLTIDNWGKLTFKPDKRGVYALVFKTANSEVAMVSFSMLTTRGFEWDFLWDSFIIAASGGVLILAGFLVEKVFNRRQTS